MSPIEIKAALRSQGFKPFTLRLASGRTFPIPHPDYLWVSPTGRTISVYAGDSDAVEVIDVILIESLEFPDGRSGASGTNGSYGASTDQP